MVRSAFSCFSGVNWLSFNPRLRHLHGGGVLKYTNNNKKINEYPFLYLPFKFKL